MNFHIHYKNNYSVSTFIDYDCLGYQIKTQNESNNFIEIYKQLFIRDKYLFVLFLLMAKANSFKSQPWTALEKGQNSLFEDDYVHDKLLTFKTTRKSATSTISLKQTFTQKEGKITSADQLKFWFPFKETKTLYGRIKNDGFKIHYDNGIITQNENKLNFYGSVQGTKSITGLVYKIGLETQAKDVLFNLRLRYARGDKPSLNLYKKFGYTQEKWNFGFVNSFNLLDNIWNSSALQLAWKQDSNNYYVRLNSGKKFEKVNPTGLLQNFTFNAIHKLNDSNRIGLEVQGNLLYQDVNNATVAWEHKCSQTANTGIKIKGDIKRNLSFSVKNSLHQYGNYIFGVNVHDFGSTNRFSYGIQVDLSL